LTDSLARSSTFRGKNRWHVWATYRLNIRVAGAIRLSHNIAACRPPASLRVVCDSNWLQTSGSEVKELAAQPCTLPQHSLPLGSHFFSLCPLQRCSACFAWCLDALIDSEFPFQAPLDGYLRLRGKGNMLYLPQSTSPSPQRLCKSLCLPKTHCIDCPIACCQGSKRTLSLSSQDSL